MRLKGFPVFLVFAFALGALMLLPALADGLAALLDGIAFYFLIGGAADPRFKLNGVAKIGVISVIDEGFVGIKRFRHA